MISIRNSVAELERCHRERDLAVECYFGAIRNVADYTIELDEEFSAPQRKYLSDLAGEVASGSQEILVESRATLRGLLRDYRDKAAKYLAGLREELAGTARALEEILDSLSQTDGDHEAAVTTALGRLRSIAASPEGRAVRTDLQAVTDTIAKSVDQIHKQHQLTVSQFQVEIRMLHKRIDSLEAAASLDELTQLFNRREIEERIQTAPPESCLLLVRVSGIRLAEVHYREDVAAELAAAFTKRLRNCLPPTAVIGRWSREEFAALVCVPGSEAIVTAKWISEHLSGSYSCLLAGKTVRPNLQVSVAVVETAGHPPDRLMERVKGFLSSD
ncbi:MAG TPA: GGDEF domain-containing protein [Bryobacteraceae bacterium]